MVHGDYSNKKYRLDDEVMTELFAQAAAKCLQTFSESQDGWVIYLHGELGAGKTCFSRAFIQTYLPGQRVKSPTYTLMETYPAEQTMLYHFDLYRLCEPEELNYLGVRDLFTPPFVALIEWPEKAKGFLAIADIELYLGYLDGAREVYFVTHTPKAARWLQAFDEAFELVTQANKI